MAQKNKRRKNPAQWKQIVEVLLFLCRQTMTNWWTVITFVSINILCLAWFGSLSFIAVLGAFLLTSALSVGIVSAIVRPVNRAVQSIGLPDAGFGAPYWRYRGSKSPLSEDSFQIYGGGHALAAFLEKKDELAVRLKQPIRDIKKPAAEADYIEIQIRKSQLPGELSYSTLDLKTLKKGEFFVGESDDGLEKLSLTDMVHILIAGQTGSGKTQFTRQLLATILTQTWNSHVCLIDMKRGIDYQHFLEAPNLELVSSYEDATAALDQVIALFKMRTDYLLKHKRSHWTEFTQKELSQEKGFTHHPIGPVLLVVDELAELSKQANKNAAGDALQEKISELARLARFTGIHLVAGTQRPDKRILDMQSKDNLVTRVCFSMPSVSASNLVIGDMSATTLGNRPGRAIYRRTTSMVIQAPLLTNDVLIEMMTQHSEKMKKANYQRKILAPGPVIAVVPSSEGIKTL